MGQCWACIADSGPTLNYYRVSGVRARASESVVGGCELESRHSHLTGYIPDQLMWGPLIPPWIMPGQG